MDVSIAGAGYVGLVTALCLADQGHRVSCVDIDEAKIARLTQGILPIYEAGLPDLLTRHLGKRFFPTTDLSEAVLASQLTMIAVGTPFENGAIDLRFIKEVAGAIGGVIARKESYHVVVVKSTVVPGTTDGLVRPILESSSGKSCGADFGLGMNPEFLREGEAVEDFQKPDRLVFGAVDARTLEVMADLYADFPNTRQIKTNNSTAEMIKYASNALLATLISYSNEIGNLCGEADDVDVMDVLSAVHLDKRLSPIAQDGTRTVPPITSYLKAGCGFGGSCFPKDVRALVRWAEQHNRFAHLLTAVLKTNEQQPQEIMNLLKKHFPVMAGVQVAVLGLAFKAGTDDIRESPALRVICDLSAAGARVIAHDPAAIAPFSKALTTPGVRYVDSMADALVGAEAVVLLTAWPEYQQLPQMLLELGSIPLVIDGRRVLDKNHLSRYEGIGLGARSQGRTVTAPGHSVRS
jgi:UDPglucose 6-dehydrogenase